MRSVLKNLMTRPEVSALAMLVLMVVVFTFASDRFLTLNNFMIVLQPLPEIALMAIGVTVLMIAGEFDLSVGSVFALSPMVMVMLLAEGMPVGLAIAVGLLAALLVGLANAGMTLKVGLPSFIATLGALFMVRKSGHRDFRRVSAGLPPRHGYIVAGRPDRLAAGVDFLPARHRHHNRRVAAADRFRQLDFCHRRQSAGGTRYGHQHRTRQNHLLLPVFGSRRICRHHPRAC